MLRAGHVIPSDSQVERLIEQGIYGDIEWDEAAPDAMRAERVSVYSILAKLRTEAARISTHATGEDHGVPIPEAIAGLARSLIEACAMDADAALGSLQLQREPDYSVRQAVNTAIVTDLLLVQRGASLAERVSVLCAALTMNLAMRDLQNQLYAQHEPLTDAQKARVLSHPKDSADLLKARAVTDPAWLETVEQHHELIDGSGYPARIAGDRLALSAQVVGLADRYCAMVTERAYRPGTAPNVALREIFLTQGKGVDAILAAQMVKELGIYPPGTLVQLANGETAVVVKRTLNSGQPIVRAILNGAGLRLPALPKRRTSHPSFAVQGVLPHARMPSNLDGAALWSPTAIQADAGEHAAEP
jgi:HD-GYP domain-containing protein (c-di-GMP phosphodiesterase class II)